MACKPVAHILGSGFWYGVAAGVAGTLLVEWLAG